MSTYSMSTYSMSTAAAEATTLSDAALRYRVCSDLLHHTSGVLPTLRDQIVDYIRILTGEPDEDSRAALRDAHVTLARIDRLSLDCSD